MASLQFHGRWCVFCAWTQPLCLQLSVHWLADLHPKQLFCSSVESLVAFENQKKPKKTVLCYYNWDVVTVSVSSRSRMTLEQHCPSCSPAQGLLFPGVITLWSEQARSPIPAVPHFILWLRMTCSKHRGVSEQLFAGGGAGGGLCEWAAEGTITHPAVTRPLCRELSAAPRVPAAAPGLWQPALLTACSPEALPAREGQVSCGHSVVSSWKTAGIEGEQNIKGRSGTLQSPWYIYASALKKKKNKTPKTQTKETYVISISKIYCLLSGN